MKALLRVIALFSLLLFLTSCDKAPDTRPDQIVCLLTKCRDMLSFCIYLLNQEPPMYYNNVAERYYYAMFSLAKIVVGPSRSNVVEKTGNHERVWQACPPKVQSLYGRELKDLRVEVDYGYSSSALNPEYYRPKLRLILEDKEAFDVLKDNVVDVYENASSRPVFFEQCDGLMAEIDNAMEEIRRKV